jgi:allophanate hydrolase
MAGLPAPMAIGRVRLADGREVLGFLCEPAAIPGAADITSYGGWRAWRERQAPAPAGAPSPASPASSDWLTAASAAGGGPARGLVPAPPEAG